jgi:hypothetical protein
MALSSSPRGGATLPEGRVSSVACPETHHYDDIESLDLRPSSRADHSHCGPQFDDVGVKLKIIHSSCRICNVTPVGSYFWSGQ